MSAPLPPTYRDCRRLLLHTEMVVRSFNRHHKYIVGTDLRQQAFAVMRGVHQAVYDRAQQASHIKALVWQVDDYKLTQQLAIEVGAFVHGKGEHTRPRRQALQLSSQRRCWRRRLANSAAAGHALAMRLHLALKDGARLQPCAHGIDFLGHVMFAQRLQVRRRVVKHCRARLAVWHRQHRAAMLVDAVQRRLLPADLAQLQALLGSYWGHFAHADSVRLRRQLFAQRPWLCELVPMTEDGRLTPAAPAQWQVRRRRVVRQILQPEGDLS